MKCIKTKIEIQTISIYSLFVYYNFTHDLSELITSRKFIQKRPLKVKKYRAMIRLNMKCLRREGLTSHGNAQKFEECSVHGNINTETK